MVFIVMAPWLPNMCFLHGNSSLFEFLFIIGPESTASPWICKNVRVPYSSLVLLLSCCLNPPKLRPDGPFRGCDRQPGLNCTTLRQGRSDSDLIWLVVSFRTDDQLVRQDMTGKWWNTENLWEHEKIVHPTNQVIGLNQRKTQEDVIHGIDLPFSWHQNGWAFSTSCPHFPGF